MVRIQVLAQFDILFELRAQPRGERVVARETLIAERRQTEICSPISVFLVQLEDASPLDTFDQNLRVAVGQFEGLNDIGNCSDLINLVGLGIVDSRVVLGRKKDSLVAVQRRLQRLH